MKPTYKYSNMVVTLTVIVKTNYQEKVNKEVVKYTVSIMPDIVTKWLLYII